MFDFPASPTNGQTFIPTVGGPVYVWDGVAWKLSSGGLSGSVYIGDAPPANPVHGQLWWESDSGNTFIYYQDANSGQWVQFNIQGGKAGYAQPRNRIVNGAMQISQENGDAPANTATYYPADQWYQYYAGINQTSAGRQVPSAHALRGSRNIYTQTTTAQPSPAAGSQWQLRTSIEGNCIRDFQWGAAAAKQAILRFTVWTANAPGTYTLSILNSATDRSYLATFPVTTYPVEIVLVIPGDTSGTWLTDTGVGMYLSWVFAAGSSLVGVPGWQGGSAKLAAPGTTNGAATASAIFYLSNVGLYLDPDNTGVAPPWQMPDEAEELRACQRYWYAIGMSPRAVVYLGEFTYRGIDFPHPVRMRANPAITATATLGTLSGPIGSDDMWQATVLSVPAGSGCQLTNIKVNARM